MRMATPPPRSVRIESSPPAEPVCELDARSTAEGSVNCRPAALLVPPGPEAPPRPTACLTPAPECDDPPAPGGLMPAPNGTPAEELSWPAGPAPVCLAWFRGSAYCLAAGEPGSAWTPGSRPRATGTGAARQLTANAARAPGTDTRRTRTSVKITVRPAERISSAQRGARIV